MNNAEEPGKRAAVSGETGQLDATEGVLRSALDDAEQAVLNYRLRLGDVLLGQGKALAAQGHIQQAIAKFLESSALRPKDIEPLDLAARLCFKVGELTQAQSLFRQALDIQPENPVLLANLGAAYQAQNRMVEAESMFLKVLEKEPRNAAVWNNLALIYEASTRMLEATRAFERSMEVDPNNMVIASNWLLALNYLDSLSPAAVLSSARSWATRFAPNQAGNGPPYANERSADKPLRVGFVSPDFRAHSVAYFLLPVLSGFDAQQVTTVCYHCSLQRDEVTESLERAARHWRNVAHLDENALSECIRKDRIDVLVDLSGHTSGTRLAVFVQRPAPIQVTWLGYPATTGLDCIDYKITDAVAAPLDHDNHFVETLVRIPGGFHTYSKLANAPAVGELPALSRDGLTFGSFNNAAKISSKTVELWAEVLLRCNNSILLLKSKGLINPSLSEPIIERFESHGVSPQRIKFLDWTPDVSSHLSVYAEVDIALDTTPYNGTTTTCEALWMGVPVLTLMGDRQCARTGASLLVSANLDEWVAQSETEFVALASEWSARLHELAILRQTLRSQVSQSPLCDGRRLSRELTQAFRNMWLKWLNQPGNETVA